MNSRSGNVTKELFSKTVMTYKEKFTIVIYYSQKSGMCTLISQIQRAKCYLITYFQLDKLILMLYAAFVLHTHKR